MSLVLEELGYSVRYAGDGHSALRQIRQESPDILLSDLKMPGMSGRQLLIEVRCLFPAIKVIAMSGSFCGSEVSSSVLADAFYPKGGGIKALLQILRVLPQRSRRAFEHLRKERLSRFDEMEATLSDHCAKCR